jgi:hypothetical protein
MDHRSATTGSFPDRPNPKVVSTLTLSSRSPVPGVYFGEDLHSIDPKGRLNIPARHRRTAAEHGGHKLKVMPGFDDCLVILDDEGFRARSDRVNTLPESAEDARWFERELFMNTAEIEACARTPASSARS